MAFYLTEHKDHLLDIPLEDFVSSHAHLYMTEKGDKPRDPHHICLKIVNVEGIPDELRAELKGRLEKCIYKWYYRPVEVWHMTWEEIFETLVDILPVPTENAPQYAWDISNIMQDRSLNKLIPGPQH